MFSGGMIYKGKLEATQCGRTNLIPNSDNFYQLLILQGRTNSFRKYSQLDYAQNY